MTNTAYIPNELKQFSTWGCYQKSTKMLISALSGAVTTPADFISLTDYTTAYEYYTKHKETIDGIAFVLPPNSDYLVVGIDTKGNEDVAKEWLNELNCYAEYSMNKESINIICRARLKEAKKVCQYGVSLLTTKSYLCMTGDRLQGFEIIQNSSQNAFDKLYDKYFKGIVRNSISYSFSKRNNNKEVLTENDVVIRIQNSLASNKYYILKSGDYRSAGFSDKNNASVGLLSILIFFTGADKQLALQMYKESNLYDKKEFEQLVGDTTLGEILYNTASQQQKVVYVDGQYNERDYLFDTDTCITKYFKEYSKDDTGNSQRVYDRYHDILKYDAQQMTFYIYNDTLGIWKAEPKECPNVRRMVDSVIEDMRSEMQMPRVRNDAVEFKEYVRNFNYLSSVKGKEHCINDLKTKSGLECSLSDFDSDIFLLNTRSGVVNLKNGQLMEHNKEFMMTKSTNCEVDLVNKPAKFLKFLKDFTCGNDELADYHKRIFGYSLTGSIEEQEYYIFKGEGNDGKSVYCDVIQKCLGDYAISVQIETFLQQRYKSGSQASPDKARMKGARVVITSEPDANATIDEGFIKQITGGDRLTARFLNKELFEFRPQCKIFIQCNNLLKINGTTRGDWRRPKIIEFNNSVPEELIDKQLREKLYGEIPQILGWAIAGCLEWQRKGMQTPQFVKDDVNAYRIESNVVLKYFGEVIEFTNKASDFVFASDLFIHFNKWKKLVGENAEISQSKFGKEAMRVQIPKGYSFDKVRENGKILYRGIKLMSLDNANENIYNKDIKDVGKNYSFTKNEDLE